MKLLYLDGLKPKVIELNYEFLCEEKKKSEAKGNALKVECLSDLLASIDASVASGNALSSDLIELIVNNKIEENRLARKALKTKLKTTAGDEKKNLKTKIDELDRKRLCLCNYSKKDRVDSFCDWIILFILMR